MLAKRASKIKLVDIIQLLEGPIAPVECVSNPSMCTRSPSCAARDVWSDLAQAMYGVLESTTLKDLVERQKKKNPGKEIIYDI
jgi:Rrf2 family protein